MPQLEVRAVAARRQDSERQGAQAAPGEVQHLECQASRWVDPIELRNIKFPPANESLIEEAIAYFEQGAGVTLVPPRSQG